MEEVNLFSRLESTDKRFEEINEELCNPEILSDQNKYKSLMKELKNLTPIVEKYREYKVQEKNLNEAKEILEESGIEKEFKEMAEAEMETAKENINKISDELKILLLPKDPNDDRNSRRSRRRRSGSIFRSFIQNVQHVCSGKTLESRSFKLKRNSIRRLQRNQLYDFGRRRILEIKIRKWSS